MVNGLEWVGLGFHLKHFWCNYQARQQTRQEEVLRAGPSLQHSELSEARGGAKHQEF